MEGVGGPGWPSAEKAMRKTWMNPRVRCREWPWSRQFAESLRCGHGMGKPVSRAPNFKAPRPRWEVVVLVCSQMAALGSDALVQFCLCHLGTENKYAKRYFIKPWNIILCHPSSCWMGRAWVSTAALGTTWFCSCHYKVEEGKTVPRTVNVTVNRDPSQALSPWLSEVLAEQLFGGGWICALC